MHRNRDSFVGSCSTVFVRLTPGSSLPAKATGHPYHDLCWKSQWDTEGSVQRRQSLLQSRPAHTSMGCGVTMAKVTRLPPNLYLKQNLNLLMSLKRADSLKAVFFCWGDWQPVHWQMWPYRREQSWAFVLYQKASSRHSYLWGAGLLEPGVGSHPLTNFWAA